MRRTKPVTIDSLLNKGPDQLGRLFNHSKQLQGLQQKLQAALEPELAPHCRALSFSQGLLTLEVDSPVWQWRLNMQRGALIDQLRQKGLRQLSTITCKVSPNVTATSPSGSATVESGFQVNRIMSHRSAEDLRQLAEQMPEPLKSKLLKLADREK